MIGGDPLEGPFLDVAIATVVRQLEEGKAKGEFEKGKIEADKDLKNFKEEIDSVSKDKEMK